MKTVIICLAMILLPFGKMQAQNDPVLTGMIYAYTDKADKKTIVKDCMNRWKRNGKIK